MAKRLGLLCLACLATSSCSEARPDWREIERLEQKATENACIGAMDNWSRHYFYSMKRRAKLGDMPVKMPDRARLAFIYKQAGVWGQVSGQHSTTAERTVEYDHRQQRIASGTFDLATGRLVVNNCGWGCGETVPVGGSCG